MTTTQSIRPNTTAIPTFSKKDQAARSALIVSFDATDASQYAAQDAELAAFDRAASARACRRIAAKLTWMVLDDQDTNNIYPAQIAELTELADWLESL